MNNTHKFLIEFFLDYKNNYISLNTFSINHGLPMKLCDAMLKSGKKLHEIDCDVRLREKLNKPRPRGSKR